MNLTLTEIHVVDRALQTYITDCECMLPAFDGEDRAFYESEIQTAEKLRNKLGVRE